MRLLSILYALPLSLAAATITPRDANAVYNDITGIDTAVRKLTAALNSYNGGILQSRPVFDATIAIHAINRQGYADATASGSFSSSDSKRIVSRTLLTPSTFSKTVPDLLLSM